MTDVDSQQELDLRPVTEDQLNAAAIMAEAKRDMPNTETPDEAYWCSRTFMLAREVDRLRAQVARVEALAREWVACGSLGADHGRELLTQFSTQPRPNEGAVHFHGVGINTACTVVHRAENR